jgi:hypothetical protein
LKVYIINSITKSYILNIKIRPLMTEYALMIKLVDGTSSAHSFNPDAYFGHSWSYFDIQNLRLVILYSAWNGRSHSRQMRPLSCQGDQKLSKDKLSLVQKNTSGRLSYSPLKCLCNIIFSLFPIDNIFRKQMESF